MEAEAAEPAESGGFPPEAEGARSPLHPPLAAPPRVPEAAPGEEQQPEAAAPETPAGEAEAAAGEQAESSAAPPPQPGEPQAPEPEGGAPAAAPDGPESESDTIKKDYTP